MWQPEHKTTKIGILSGIIAITLGIHYGWLVEPIFGDIRIQKGLDHFRLRGKEKVDIQWMLYAMVHNIEKIAHYGQVA